MKQSIKYVCHVRVHFVCTHIVFFVYKNFLCLFCWRAQNHPNIAFINFLIKHLVFLGKLKINYGNGCVIINRNKMDENVYELYIQLGSCGAFKAAILRKIIECGLYLFMQYILRILVVSKIKGDIFMVV